MQSQSSSASKVTGNGLDS